MLCREMLLALAAHHVDRYASDLSLRTDRDRLLVAAGRQVQGRGETRRLDEDFDLAAASPALQVAIDVAAGFAPGADNAVALGGHIAAEIEFVAIAGATQGLLQAAAAAIDLVTGLAANAFRRSVRKRNGAVA